MWCVICVVLLNAWFWANKNTSFTPGFFSIGNTPETPTSPNRHSMVPTWSPMGPHLCLTDRDPAFATLLGSKHQPQQASAEDLEFTHPAPLKVIKSSLNIIPLMVTFRKKQKKFDWISQFSARSPPFSPKMRHWWPILVATFSIMRQTAQFWRAQRCFSEQTKPKSSEALIFSLVKHYSYYCPSRRYVFTGQRET